MKKQPKISIIIPVYNTEKYLRQCLTSVVNQTLKDIEIICVNDGSTDNSLSILKEYAKKDNRIKIIEKTVSSGAGDSRNQGIKVAQGEYLWFVDSDDWAELSTCEEVYKYILKNKDIDFLIFDADTYCNNAFHCNDGNLNKSFLPQENPFYPEDYAETLFYISNPPAWNKIYSSAFINKNKLEFQNLSSCNDIAFTRLSFAMAEKIGYINSVFYHYRTDAEGAISRKRGKNCLNVIRAFRYIKNKLRGLDKYRMYKNCFYKSIIPNILYEKKYASFWGRIILKLYYLSINNFKTNYK
ncbi:MAG: glycosyltransferase family 2 protein [Alphaproteobacteria bacterium]|nr:glycosyltransferase family 2 protein [Alphaproteobacteria bacterium]